MIQGLNSWFQPSLILAGPNASNSPALPGDYSGRGREGFLQAASHQAEGSIQTLNSQDTVSIIYLSPA